jgi:hypothetical protein
VALPRGVSLSLAGGGAVLLGGLIGLVWWLRRLRRGRLGGPRPGLRVEITVAAVVLALVGVGIVTRSKVAFDTVASCRPPIGARPSRPAGAALMTEKVITWPETGIGLLWGDAIGASRCWYAPTDYYVDLHSGRYGGARIMNVGDIVLAPPSELSKHNVQALAQHESRHRSQWAVLTVIGGPLAFPIAYGVDDFFFPGSRNHFERLAGLEAGGYERAGTAPVIGWPQLVVLIVVVALLVVYAYRRVRRRRPYKLARLDRPH